jgi:hypothetical protein
MKTKVTVVILAVLLLGFVGSLAAQETGPRQAALTIPWDEFKHLLHLEENQIVLSLEIYQKLLAQTGAEIKPVTTLSNGQVILTRTDFEQLVNQMKAPAGPDLPPPFDYLITKALYEGKMDQNSTRFTATFQVHILKKDAFLKVPLLPQNIAIEDLRVNDRPALVTTDNGYHNIVLNQKGEYNVVARFSLKTALDKGPHQLNFSIQRTPITLLKLEIPLQKIEVEIPQAQQILTELRGQSTFISAVIAPNYNLTIQWRKQLEPTEKIPPKLYAEVYHLVSIEDDALKVQSELRYNILHSEISEIRIQLPENLNILNIYGDAVGEWQESVQDGQRIISIPFTYDKKGQTSIYLTTEKSLSDQGKTVTFEGLRTLDVVRETGFIGVELKTSAEVKVIENENLERVAVQKLPPQLLNRSVKPLIDGFKFLKHPYSLVLEIEKHEKLPVPIATINSASVVTLFTEDGKIVHRLIYQVRNSAKQFLEINIPEGADVWSVFVGKAPVESSLNAAGKLLVPLIRSQTINNQLDTFPVEVIYCLSGNRFSATGSLSGTLPAVDLLISQLLWSVYLPYDYNYLYFRSSLEKEDIIRGVNLFSGALRRYDENAFRELAEIEDHKQISQQKDKLAKIYRGKSATSEFRNLPMQQEQLASQVANEMEFSGRLEGLSADALAPLTIPSGTGTGLLPIQIEIPTGGQVYRFAKTLIQPEDPLEFSVNYTRSWLMSSLKWLLIVLVILILFLCRRIFRRLWNRIDPHDYLRDLFSHLAESNISIVVLLFLMILFLFIQKWIALLFLLVLLGALLSRIRQSQIERQNPPDTKN